MTPSEPLAAPRVLVIVSAIVVLAGTVMLGVGAWTTGTAWDETYHVVRLRNYFDHGLYLTDFDLVGDDPRDTVRNRYVYGPVAMLLLHAVAVIAGAEHWGAPQFAAEAHAWRHLGVMLLALMTVAISAVIAHQVLRRWGWGLVCAALLMSIPVWSGHSMMNIKDVPVAAGCTMLTLGLVMALRSSQQSTPIGWRLPLSAVLMASGVVVAMGTRPGIWPGLAGAVGLSGIVILLQHRRGHPRARRSWIWLGTVGTAPLIGGAALLALYPRLAEDPVRLLLGSAAVSASYRGGGTASRLYIPVHVLLQVPIGITALALAGVAVAVVAMVRRAPSSALLVPVVCQAGLLPALALLRGSDLYNGLRQLLFAAPAVAVLACIGTAWLVERAHRSDRWPPLLVAALSSCAMLVPTVAQARLFPYGYVFYTPVADAGGLVPDTDYWRTSVRELAPSVPTDRRIVCSPYVLQGQAMRFGFDGSGDCRVDEIGPLARYLPQQGPTGPSEVEAAFTAILERYQTVPDNCRPVGSVERGLRLRRLTMSQVLRCRLPIPDARTTEARFGPTLENWELLYRGWTTRQANDGVQSTDNIAQLAFRLTGPSDVLRLSLSNQVEAEVRLGGRVVERLGPSSSIRQVDVPLRALEPGDVVDLALVAKDRLGAQLSGLELLGPQQPAE